MVAIDERARQSIAVSLLSCFDFVERGFVDHESWRRGLSMVLLPEVADDDSLWGKLVNSYGTTMADSKHEMVDVSRIPERAPLAGDPILMSHVMRALMRALHDLSEEVELLKTLPRRTDANREEVERLSAETSAMRAHARTQLETRKARTIMEARRRVTLPAIRAWAELMVAQRRARRLSALSATNPGLCRSLRRWRAHATQQASTFAAALRCASMTRAAVQALAYRGLADAWWEWASNFGSVRERRVRLSGPRGWRLLMRATMGTWRRRVQSGRSINGDRGRSREMTRDSGWAPPRRPAPTLTVVTAPPAAAPKEAPTRSTSPTGGRPTAPLDLTLSVFGKSVAPRCMQNPRDLALDRATALAAAEHNRASSLQARLTLTEARAAVLERREVLRTSAADPRATLPHVQAQVRAAVASAVDVEVANIFDGAFDGVAPAPERSGERPAERSGERPAERSGERPAERSGERPAERSADAPSIATLLAAMHLGQEPLHLGDLEQLVGSRSGSRSHLAPEPGPSLQPRETCSFEPAPDGAHACASWVESRVESREPAPDGAHARPSSPTMSPTRPTSQRGAYLGVNLGPTHQVLPQDLRAWPEEGSGEELTMPWPHVRHEEGETVGAPRPAMTATLTMPRPALTTAITTSPQTAPLWSSTANQVRDHLPKPASPAAAAAAATAAAAAASALSPRVRGPRHVLSARAVHRDRPGGAPAHRPAPPRPRSAGSSTPVGGLIVDARRLIHEVRPELPIRQAQWAP
jgi:hypothetical protein